MIGPLKTLFDRQSRRLEEDAEFVSHLDPSRTATLNDLIADVRRPERLALLDAPWLDVPRFSARLAAACLWLEGVAIEEGVKGWPGIPLMFFQAGSVQEDALEHWRLVEQEAEEPAALRLYTKRYGHLPPAVQYLHTHTKICTALQGTYAERSLRMRPHFTVFSSYTDPLVYDQAHAFRPVRGRIVGYRLTDLAALLGVSSAVATDVFVRIAVHDLLHGFLPSTPFQLEGFHNIVALQAMGRLPESPYRDAWERFVHAECTDPFFCLRATREIAEVRRAIEPPSLVQEDYLSSMVGWYASPNALRKRVAYWDLPADAPESLAIRILEDRIRFAKNDGFRLYVRHMKRS